jgi:hypothetical protein
LAYPSAVSLLKGVIMSGPFTVATQILVDGPRNTVSKTTGDFTSGGGLPANSTVLDPALLTSMNPGMSGSFPATLLRVDHIDYSIADGIVVQLLWDATTPVPICELYGRGKLEAAMWGGYQNNAGAGVTGKILIAFVLSAAALPADSSVLVVLKTVKFRPISVGGA